MRFSRRRYFGQTSKLWLLFALLASLAVGNAALAVWGVERVSADLRSAIAERTRKMELAEKVERGVYHLWLAALADRPAEAERIAGEVGNHLYALGLLVHTPTGKERLAALRERWQECWADVLAGENLSPSRLEKLGEAVDSFLSWQRQQLERETAAASRRAAGVGLWLELLTVLSVALLLTLTFTVGQRAVDAAVAAEMVVAHTKNAVVAVDRWGRIVAVNQAFEQLVGRDRRQLVGRPYSQACGRLYPLPAVLAGGQPRVGEEIAVAGAQGEERYLLADALPWRDPQGEVAGGMLVLRDITARKRAEAVLEELAARDSLTGLFNQRYFTQRLEEEVAEARERGSTLALLLLDVDFFKLYNDTWGHPRGDEVLREVAAVLSRSVRRGDVVARYGGDEFAVILPGADRATAAEVARRIREVVEDTPFYGREVLPEGRLTVSVGLACFPEAASPAELLRQADEAMYEAKWTTHTRVERLLSPLVGLGGSAEPGMEWMLSGLSSVLRAVEVYDRYTYRHCQQVMRYSDLVAEALELKEPEREQLRLAAFLHDVGKVCIPLNLLTKTGMLAPEELEQMRRHPVYGAMLLRAFQALDPVVKAVLHHHERWDGTGYPAGLKGKDIPLFARIIAVADSFDAMLSDRPYRRSLGVVRALEEIEAGAGSQFDPLVAARFLEAYRLRYPRFTPPPPHR